MLIWVTTLIPVRLRLVQTSSFNLIMFLNLTTMKRNNIYAFLGVLLALSSCKKDFTVKPSLDATTLSNYYNTADEGRGLTSTLYGLPWSGYENRVMDAIGDVMS